MQFYCIVIVYVFDFFNLDIVKYVIKYVVLINDEY